MSSSSVNEPAEETSTEQSTNGFIRSIKLPTAIAINMTQMCGIGPFILR